MPNKLKGSKRRKRKHRHIPYKIRQEKYLWLETHMWHNKRFHITKQWGYSLPDNPNNKGLKGTLRAAKESCLMQDLSFTCCIEVKGLLEDILKGLSYITSLEGQQLLQRSKINNGQIWTTIPLFAHSRCPSGAVGHGDVLWHPSDESNNAGSRTMWMWVHPSIHDEVIENLIKAFSLTLIISEVNKDENTEEMDSDGMETEDEQQKQEGSVKEKNILKAIIALRNVPFTKVPKYRSSDGNIGMCLLKDTLNRFRLIGPESYSVLAKILIPSTVSPEAVIDTDGEVRSNDAIPWWHDFYSKPQHIDDHQQQTQIMEQMSVNNVTPRCVLPLTVRDPRVVLPMKNSSIDSPPRGTLIQPPNWSVRSPLQHSHLRDEITLSKAPDAEINARRSEQLVPTGLLPLTATETRLPVILLHRPAPYTSYGDGWDLILPCGWGSVTWVALILSGAVAAGQKDEVNLITQSICTPIPPLLPDTLAGHTQSLISKQLLTTEHFKRPTNCRQNYIKLGVQFPFSAPWLQIIRDWNPGASEVRALRSTSELTRLNGIPIFHETENVKGRDKHRLADDAIAALVKDLKKNEGFLIHVRMTMEGDGAIEPNAMICFPNDDDTMSEVIKEPRHVDIHQEERRQIEEEHTKKKDFLEKVNGLCVLSESLPIQMCSRKIIGYVSNGGFNPTLERESGIGWIVLKPLLASISKTKILIRNPTELTYKWANVSLLMSSV